MQPTPSNHSDSFERFTVFCTALELERNKWGEPTSWLRFTAQAAVATPGDPQLLASAIRDMATSFYADTGWTNALHSPLRYVVAALLVQIGDHAVDFMSELTRVGALFRAAGLPHGGIYEIMSILLLRIGANRTPISHEQVQRLQVIYAQLKKRHWWLTGPHDLPTCAIQVSLPGSPEDIGCVVEDHYRLLCAHGFSKGIQLEQAAHILPLLRLPAKDAVRRYADIARYLTVTGTSPWRGDYEAVSLLSFCEQAPDIVSSTCLGLYDKLKGFRPILDHEVLIDLAADLAVLDLIGHTSQRPDPSTGSLPLADRLRDEQCAAAIIACFGARSIDRTSF